jgi:hypothetical protein
MAERRRLYALIDDRPIPVESLKSIVAGIGGRILIAGAATSDQDRRQVRTALSPLKKKDVVSFNVVTGDWHAVTGNATITDVVLAAKPDSGMHFYLAMKMIKNKPRGRKE